MEIKNNWKLNAKVSKDQYVSMYEKSINENNNYWEEQGKRIDWIKKYTKIKDVKYSSNEVSIKWYFDGTLNADKLAMTVTNDAPNASGTTRVGSIALDGDNNGIFEMGIPGEFMKSPNIELVAGTNLIFKPFRQKLDYSNTKGIYQDVRIGPSKTLEGPIYLTNKKYVHFREKPDVGSETKFLLDKGESVAVKRMTRGEYFGDIEVLLQDGILVVFDGWVVKEDMTLMQLENIFSKESNHEPVE